MLAKVITYGLCGLDAYPVTIEVDVTRGLPATVIVGLPDSAVKESKERVRSAIKNSQYEFAAKRITLNLAPADIKKEGSSFELAMALGILAATGQCDGYALNDFIVLGELSLDGRVQPVTGALAVAMSCNPRRFRGLIVPEHNAPEAALCRRIPVYPVRSLREAVYILSQPPEAKPFTLPPKMLAANLNEYDIDFADVRGQYHVKRGLEVAAAGGHNILLIGPPGCGKSMLAKRIPTILPELTLREALETTRIHSVAGLINPADGPLTRRPFRAPHHTASSAALVGGGPSPKPGEVSLAHNGILFLDELPEFHRDVLEALRQPLEDHVVTVARASRSSCFPARFMLVAAMNPCPCGWYTDPAKPCHCSANRVRQYYSRISGPLLDRMDIHLDVPSVPYKDLSAAADGESSAQIRRRTCRARLRQRQRLKSSGIHANAQMSHRQIRQFCGLSPEASRLLKAAMQELRISARAHDKILRIARTIADLEDTDTIAGEHIAEAIQYRSLDRNWWG